MLRGIIMLSKQKWLSAVLAITLAPIASAVTVGDGPNKRHIEQSDIDNGNLSLFQIINHGRHVLFDDFNEFDGHGDPERPGINSSGNQSNFNRVSGMDSVACVHCHTKPFLGGAGDYAQSIYPEFNRPDGVNILGFEGLNVKNAKSIFGVGPKEMLAREMNAEITATKEAALAEAAASGQPVTVELNAKTTNYGRITAMPDGTIDTSEVEGISHDLFLRPFVSVGAFPNLRTIVVGAMEQHHGVEAEEGFGLDDDGDGVERELTVGDVTSAAVFMAALNVPTQVLPRNGQRRRAAIRGRGTFEAIGCGECHTPTMLIDNPVFTQSAPGTDHEVSFDLTRDGFFPRIRRDSRGRGVVNLFSDLKRHDMGDFLTEAVEEVERESHQHFITMPLWGVGNTGPWLHDGRARSLSEAILLHGGEAQASRDNFAALNDSGQAEVVEFLKSLQVTVVDPRYLLPNLPLPGILSRASESSGNAGAASLKSALLAADSE
jgi:hypothetical protein